MAVLVTGAAGFIGYHVCEALLGRARLRLLEIRREDTARQCGGEPVSGGTYVAARTGLVGRLTMPRRYRLSGFA